MDIKVSGIREIMSGLKNQDSFRIAKRIFLKVFLPIDFQLLVKEDNWHFDGELLRRRRSQLASDKFFFENLPLFKASALAKMSLDDLERLYTETMKKQIRLYRPVMEDLDPLFVIYRYLDWLRMGQRNYLRLAMGDLGLGLVQKNPFLAREIREELRKNNDDFEADLISIGFGEDRDKISADINKFLASGEYYAAGKLAVLTGDREAVKYCLEKLLEIINRQTAIDSLPKNFSYFYPISDKESRRYLCKDILDVSEELGESGTHQSLSFSFVELFQLVIPEDKEFGRKLFHRLLKAGRKFEAAMAAIALGDTDFAKRVRYEFYFAKRYRERMALTLALGASDPEFGWSVVESWLEEHLDPLLPPIGAAKLAAIVCGKINLDEIKRQKILDLFKKLLDAGGILSLYSAGMLAIGIKDRNLLRQVLVKLENNPVEHFYVLHLEMAYLKEIDFSLETKRALKAIYSISSEVRYLVGIVFSLSLLCFSGLSCIRTYLSSFMEIKNLFLSSEDRNLLSLKKEEKLSLFEMLSSFLIPQLQWVFPEKVEGVIRILLSRGILLAFHKLKSYEVLFLEPEFRPHLFSWLKFYSSGIGEAQFLKLLDFAVDYSAAGCLEIFVKIISEFPPYEKLILELEKSAETIFFKKLGIKENMAIENGSWPKNYSVYLLGHDNLLRSKPRSKSLRFFYKTFLRAVFQNRFQEWISDLEQEDKIGQKIARHNQEVEKAFLTAGVNWGAWNNPGFEEVVSVKECNPREIAEAWRLLEEYLSGLQKFFQGSPLLPSLRKDIISLQKQKNKPLISERDLKGSDWLKKIFPICSRSLESMEKSKKERQSTPVFISESSAFFAKTLVEDWLSKFNAKRSFRIRIWKRNPSHDLFHGNYSKCCLALGVKSLNQDGDSVTIMDYLVDKGIQVLEIIDEQSQETVGQCWPFLSRGKSGELLLAIDSIDLDYPHRIGSRYNLPLRDGMFRFLKRYAEATSAKRVVLGATWNYESNEFLVDNKMPTDDLSGALFEPIEKLGGYWNRRPYFLYMQGVTKGFLIQ